VDVEEVRLAPAVLPGAVVAVEAVETVKSA
jgi:hypothetical protein